MPKNARARARDGHDTRALLVTRDALAEIEARAQKAGAGCTAIARIARAALKASLKASRGTARP